MTPRQPDEILGPHPEHDAFGCHTQAEDTNTNSHLPHRALSQDSYSRDETVEQIREALIRHHASEEMREPPSAWLPRIRRGDAQISVCR